MAEIAKAPLVRDGRKVELTRSANMKMTWKAELVSDQFIPV